MNNKFKKAMSVLLSMIFILTMAVPAFAADKLPGSILITDSKVIDSKDFKLIAYRGLSACAPENTLAAISLAGRSGCYGCEIDIQPTVDGWVCFQDLTLDAKTTGTGFVNLYTNSELSSVVIDKGNNIENYPNQKIPTVTDAINTCKIYDMKPYLVLKNGTVDETRGLIATLKTLGALSSTTIISSNSSILSLVKNEGGKTAYNALAIATSSITTCKNNGYNGIYATDSVTNDVSAMKAAVNSGIEVLCHGVDTLSKAETYYNNGIKTVMSASLVMHAPSAEKVTYSIFTTLSTVFKNLFNFFTKLIRKLLILITGEVIEGQM